MNIQSPVSHASAPTTILACHISARMLCESARRVLARLAVRAADC
ncbi:hypothetical protein [Gluconobacter cerevisiae]|nr:hypothetical protein [Gluconobacter cerevisiae]